MSYPWGDAMVVTDGVAQCTDGTAWCDDCGAHRSFSVLLEPEEGMDDELVYWCCSVCGGVPDVCPWSACGCGNIIDCARLVPSPRLGIMNVVHYGTRFTHVPSW